MASSKQPAQQTTTQTSEPPAFLRPALEEAVGGAQDIFAGGPQQFFPGSTVVPFAPETEQALTGITQRAQTGSPLVQGAQQTALETIQGRGVNPFLGEAVTAATNPLFERFQESTLPGLRSAFAGLGRSGSGAEKAALTQSARELGRGVSEQASKLAFGSAEAEAARQQQALQLAPGLAQQDFSDLQRLAQVGGAREGLAGATLQEQIDRFNFGQQAPSQALNQLIAQLGGLGGGGTVTTQGPSARATGGFGGQLLGGIGGAASGVGLATGLAKAGALSAPFTGPVGLGLAGLGGLAGLFG